MSLPSELEEQKEQAELLEPGNQATREEQKARWICLTGVGTAHKERGASIVGDTIQRRKIQCRIPHLLLLAEPSKKAEETKCAKFSPSDLKQTTGRVKNGFENKLTISIYEYISICLYAYNIYV